VDKKIKSVIETSRLKHGDIVYKLSLRYKNIEEPILKEEDVYLNECHPKELYKRGPLKQSWNKNRKLPRLHHVDFSIITNLLSSDLIVEEFTISDIIRSSHTGEFIYQSTCGDWMPESCLFDSSAAAYSERNRIYKMIRSWSTI
jgi:hypothetical protein